MATTTQYEPVKTVCQRHDSPKIEENETAVHIPASWKLTPQQKAFIDTFAEDERKKQ
nr:hypothetical protein [uncultured Enterobacter sp.]